MNIIDKFFRENAAPLIANFSADEKKQLAEYVGVHVRTITYYGKGERVPKKERMPKVLEFLGLPQIGEIQQNQLVEYLEDKVEKLTERNKDLKDEIKSFKIEHDECIEEIKKLKKLLAMYDKVLETCSPPNDVEERRFCRIEYLKLVKKFGLKTT